MRILIIGINGFIGRSLATFLLESKRKIKVYGIDIQKKTNLDKGIIFFKCDILNTKKIEKIYKKIKPDVIYHLAAQVSVIESFKSPQKTLKINIVGTINILEAAKKFSPKAIILIPGSSEEYGEIKSEGKIKENYPLRPLSSYAVSKVCQELIGYQYYQGSGLKVVLVRPFNITGPGQSEKAVCSNFAKKIAEIEAKKEKPIIRVGNLKIIRDFIDVRDIVRAYCLAIEKCKYGEIYNIASGRGYKIENILKKLLSLSKKKIKLKKDPNLFRKNEPLILVGNTTKFRKTTGWKPEIDLLNQTLPELLNYWRKRTAC